MLTSVQTTVQDPAPGAPGMRVDLGPSNVETHTADGPIPFGAYVVIKDGVAKLPASAADVAEPNGGIALADGMRPTGAGYDKGDLVLVMTLGKVWVATEGDLPEGKAPFVRFTAAPGAPAGGFRKDADTGKAAAAANVLIKRGTASAGVAIADVLRATAAPAP